MVINGLVLNWFIIFFLLTSSAGYAQNINLRDTTNQYDYIIITVPEFVSSCTNFKNHKQTYNHFKVLIADTGMIYSQFPDSTKKEDKIRNFVSYAGTYWKSPRPKYFLIAGNREKISNHFVSLLYMIGYTDFYYSESIYDSEDDSMDFFIGRVPANTTADLNNYFSKVIQYENSNIEDWNNKTLFVAENDSLIYEFPQQASEISSLFPNYIKSKVLVADANKNSNGNKDSLLLEINRGVSSLWLFGHGSDSTFASGYLTMQDINQLTNDKYFLLLSSCSEQFAYNANISLYDEAVLSNKGAIGAIGFTSNGWWQAMLYLFNKFGSELYREHNLTLGEIVHLYNSLIIEPLYFLKINTNIWGDPSLRLKYNIQTEVNTSENPAPITFTLMQNYPNPFNPTCQIRFSLLESGFTSLKVYDILGKEAATLVNDYLQPGVHSVEFKAVNLSSGMYFYTLTSGSYSQTKKMILLR